MPLAYTVTTTVDTTAQSDDSTRLFHGTVGTLADCIMAFGINADQARQASQVASNGAFWLTNDYWEAVKYSQVPSYYGGEPTIVAVDVPNPTLEFCFEQGFGWVREGLISQGCHYFEFLPPSHGTLNANMTNVTLTVVQL